MAHPRPFEKGDAPAIVVGVGAAAAHGEARKAKDNVGGDIAVHSEELAHGVRVPCRHSQGRLRNGDWRSPPVTGFLPACVQMRSQKRGQAASASPLCWSWKVKIGTGPQGQSPPYDSGRRVSATTAAPLSTSYRNYAQLSILHGKKRRTSSPPFRCI